MATLPRTNPSGPALPTTPTTPPVRASRQRAWTIVVWSLSVLLALMFLASGWGKLTNGATAAGMSFDEQFVAWGLPAWFRFPVGLAELAGAVGLLVPRVRFLAGAGLTLLMVGAVGTHVANAEWIVVAIPAVLGALTATVAWLTRPTWVVERLGGSRAQTV
jgi:putative oxidoreductase